MIQAKSQQLIELSQNKIALKKYANNLQGFQSRQTQIAQAVADIRPLVSALKAFRQRGIADFDLNQKADTLLSIIVATETKFQENPEWIIDQTSFNYRTFKANVESLKNSLRQQLSQAWKSYLAQHMPSTNNEMLNLLAEVEAFKATVQRIQRLDLQIQQVEFPNSSEDFERVDQLIDLLRQSWNSLSSDEVPEAVLSFLKAAANLGAPIDLLTPDVKDWLTRHRIAGSLRIRLT